MYFRAFSLYQGGSLRESRDVLKSLEKSYPKADLSDAKSLGAHVCGELAQRGDAECAAEIAKAADPDARSSGSRPSTQTQRRECSEDENDERIVALNALLQMDADRAMPILKKVLERRERNCGVRLRHAAIEPQELRVVVASVRVVATDLNVVREVRVVRGDQPTLARDQRLGRREAEDGRVAELRDRRARV